MHYKLYEAEIPVRNAVRRCTLLPSGDNNTQDCTNDRLVAEATLSTRLGTLRYLKQLQASRLATDAAPSAAEERVMCPVCHDALGRELVMLSCGHQLCAPCSMKMLEKLPKQTPKVRLRVDVYFA